MASKRDQIKLSDQEVGDFLTAERVITVATLGSDGWPHLTALWFVMRDREPWIYTYGKSQKVKNLERDPRATLLAERGDEYQELRGVMLKTSAEIRRQPDEVSGLAEQIFVKYQGNAQIDDTASKALRAQAAKRVAIRFVVEQTISWDHAKLGGSY